MSDDGLVYKVCERAEWAGAVAAGRYEGSPDDRRDGFIHFSTAAQLAGTLGRHFHGRSDLVLLAFDSAEFGARLKWEPSRGGALFPHLYGPLDPALAVTSVPLATDASGNPQLPASIATANGN